MYVGEGALEAGSSVWVPCRSEVWRLGVVVGPLAGGDPGTLVVQVPGPFGKFERVEVSRRPVRGEVQVHPQNEVLRTSRGALALTDLSHLPLLHEPAILQALQLRFREGVVYTLTGPVLLAVNPFCEVAGLYGREQLSAFVDLPAEEEPSAPHIFGVARAAYQGIRLRGAHQTVLVSGESGAGKTETTKFVMRFLALAGAGGTESSMSIVERQVLESIPLLEALGNAKTLRNDNSSRFGKYIELQFGRPSAGCSASPRLLGAHTHTYLLEKVRVVGQQEGERSFHIFYQVLAAAASAEEAPACGVGYAPADFAYLRRSSRLPRQTSEGPRDEAEAFGTTRAALAAFGIEGPEAASFFGALMAVLHLGNVCFSAPASNSEGSEFAQQQDSAGAVARCCELLGVEEPALAAALCCKTMKAPGEGVIIMPAPVLKASESRDALARHLYGAVFAFVVGRINGAVASASTGAATRAGAAAAAATCETGDARRQLPFVGVLDIFGFEFFDTNSLEQLFINFTNELLQQYFNEVIFENETELYRREGIAWNPLDFPSNRVIVELIGRAPPGILPMLDEECATVGGNSEKWCSKLQRTHGSRRHFEAVKQRQGHFLLTHFAGQVEYTSQAFVEKNRDQLGVDIVKCMKGSGSDFVRQRFLEHDRVFGSQETVDSRRGLRRMARARKYTVSSEFRGQLDSLMERIHGTEPHFVRCVKPNPRSLPGEFDRQSVVQQLRYQGVLQAIEVSRAGFPMRLRHRQGVLQFRCLADPRGRLQLEAQIARGSFAEAARVLFQSLSACLTGLVAGTWAVGASLIFLKREGVEVLTGALSKCRRISSVRLQAVWRARALRCRFGATREAARRLQAGCRGLAARRRAAALRRTRAAVRLQSAWRARAARALRRRLLAAARALQSHWHALQRRRWLLRALGAVVVVQAWWRGTAQRLRNSRRGRAALAVQRTWRGHRERSRGSRRLLALLRRRRAGRRLLWRWRGQVCDRLLGGVGDLGWPSLGSCPPAPATGPCGEPDAAVGPVESPGSRKAADAGEDAEASVCAADPAAELLLGVCSGQLVAASAELGRRLASLEVQVASARWERRQVVSELKDLQHWTVLGMMRSVVAKVVGKDCAHGTLPLWV